MSSFDTNINPLGMISIGQNLNDNKVRILPSGEFNGINGHKASDTHIDMREETYTTSQEDLKRALHDTILKRIPAGAEATTVLVSTINKNTNFIFCWVLIFNFYLF